jgi:hypothetical protein
MGAALSSLGAKLFSEAVFEEESFCPSPDTEVFSLGPEACDCLSHTVSDISLIVDEISSSFGKVDVDAVPDVGDEGPEASCLEESATVTGC